MQITREGRFRFWVPAICWATIILLLSGDEAGSPQTGSLLHAIFPGLSAATLEIVNTIFRKTGHVIGYATLGFLSFRGARGPRRGWSAPWSAIAIAFAVMIAITDEAHQATTRTRGGSAWDVLLDSSAAVLAQVIVWAIASRDR